MHQRGVDHDRTQVRVYPQQLPQGQQAGLGTPLPFRARQIRVADRAEQHRVGLDDRRPRPLRQGIPGLRDAGRADGVLAAVDPVAEQIRRGVQDLQRLRGDLGTDAVARKHGKGEPLHRWARSKAAIASCCCRVRPISSRPWRSISLRYAGMSKADSKPRASRTVVVSRSTVSS